MRWLVPCLITLNLLGQTAPTSVAALKPDLPDIKYGSHQRNVFDLYKAKSDKPTPLLVYVHGGGFLEGDKRSSLNQDLLARCLNAGISVASINYRYSTQAPAPAPYMDTARAVQFLRANAKGYNLDTARFAAFGNSAGAGMVLWLAFHDDLADPKAEDPILRQSTRLKCVYVTAAQCSYDPRWIKAHIPGSGWKHSALVALFAIKPDEREHPPADKAKLMEDLAPINHVKAGAPPVFMWYGRDRSIPAADDLGGSIHHPKFGDLLKEKLDAVNTECVLKVKEPIASKPTYLDFLKKHLEIQ